MKYLYFLFPTVVTYVVFYIWQELMPDDDLWWTTPTYILLYVICVISFAVSIGKFSKAK